MAWATKIRRDGKRHGHPADAEQQHHQAKRGDGGLRQHLLEVGLAKRERRAPEQRQAPKPPSRPCQSGVPPSSGDRRARR